MLKIKKKVHFSATTFWFLSTPPLELDKVIPPMLRQEKMQRSTLCETDKSHKDNGKNEWWTLKAYVVWAEWLEAYYLDENQVYHSLWASDWQKGPWCDRQALISYDSSLRQRQKFAQWKEHNDGCIYKQ